MALRPRLLDLDYLERCVRNDEDRDETLAAVPVLIQRLREAELANWAYGETAIKVNERIAQLEQALRWIADEDNGAYGGHARVVLGERC